MIRQFPDALDMIIRSIRVGIPVLGAIGTVAREAQPPTSQEFTKLGNDLAVGVPLDKAVTALADRNDLAEFRFFATAIGLQAQTGGGLSDTLESLADLIRKRIALKERGHALSSEARTSALILGSLPIVMGLGLWAMNPGYMQVLWTTSEGRMVMGAAMISLLCGAITMKVIISRSLT
jgi:tight adherence protein B